MSVSAIPEGYHTVTPYLIVRGAARALDYYRAALGAETKLRMETPDGQIAHAEIRIGDSTVMLADEYPEMGALSPETVGGTPVLIMLYVKDVDTTFRRAVDGGAEVLRGLEDQFYGDRTATIRDPFGHRWTLATHIEDVPEGEMERRFEAMMGQSNGA